MGNTLLKSVLHLRVKSILKWNTRNCHNYRISIKPKLLLRFFENLLATIFSKERNVRSKQEGKFIYVFAIVWKEAAIDLERYEMHIPSNYTFDY